MRRKKQIGNILFHLVCILFALTSLYPILWMIASSLKDSSQVFVDAANLIPRDFKIENYINGWKGFGGISFSTFFKNTFVIVLLSVLGTVVTCPFVAYGFARMEFPFKNVCFLTILVSLMLPGQVVMVPQYIMFNKWNWVNTYLPLVLPSLFAVDTYFVFMLIQFLRGVPKELEEAAKIDGCNTLKTLWYVIVPMLKPSLVSCALFQFMWTNNDFQGPLIYISDMQKYTNSVYLRMSMDSDVGFQWNRILAMSLISILPSLIVFFCAQDSFIDGIAAGGVKG